MTDTPRSPCLVHDHQIAHHVVSHWLESDHDNLAASLARFVGSPAYGPGTLHDDIARFRFLLGATDGEGLFTLDEP